jgi:hypothetical protein
MFYVLSFLKIKRAILERLLWHPSRRLRAQASATLLVVLDHMPVLLLPGLLVERVVLRLRDSRSWEDRHLSLRATGKVMMRSPGAEVRELGMVIVDSLTGKARFCPPLDFFFISFVAEGSSDGTISVSNLCVAHRRCEPCCAGAGFGPGPVECTDFEPSPREPGALELAFRQPETEKREQRAIGITNKRK